MAAYDISLPTAPCVGSRMVVWRTSGASLQDQQTSEFILSAFKAHESGKKHKEHAAAWQQAQKDKASRQQRMDKGTEYIARSWGSPVRRHSRAKISAIASFPYPAAIGEG
eukprot:1148921-Pelagomonas_calceolata.AAC.1